MGYGANASAFFVEKCLWKWSWNQSNILFFEYCKVSFSVEHGWVFNVTVSMIYCISGLRTSRMPSYIMWQIRGLGPSCVGTRWVMGEVVYAPHMMTTTSATYILFCNPSLLPLQMHRQRKIWARLTTGPLLPSGSSNTGDWLMWIGTKRMPSWRYLFMVIIRWEVSLIPRGVHLWYL